MSPIGNQTSGIESQKLAVICPLLNESKCLTALLAELENLNPDEIAFVDGGSWDGTIELIKRWQTSHELGSKSKLIHASPGRGPQQNLGVENTVSENLLFLHADTCLPEGAKKLIVETLHSEKPPILGAFQFELDQKSISFLAVEWLTKFRNHALKFPFGDQGIFMTRNAFEDVGGFPNFQTMEDFVLVQRAQKKGKVKVLKETATTSTRRWEANGLLKTFKKHFERQALWLSDENSATKVFQVPKRGLSIFLKPPLPGQVKTRLAKGVGEGLATMVYQELGRHVFEVASNEMTQKHLDMETFIFSDRTGYDQDIKAWLGAKRENPLVVQRGEGLGERMGNAFRWLEDRHYKHNAIIGTDCPKIDERIFSETMGALSKHDLVLGPTSDGGYYLIALSIPFMDGLFTDVEWSTQSVLDKTLANAKKLSLSTHLLPKLDDIDEKEDLVNFTRSEADFFSAPLKEALDEKGLL